MDIRKIIKEEIKKVLNEEFAGGIVGLEILSHFPFVELSDTREGANWKGVPGWGNVQIPSLDTADASTQIVSKADMVEYVNGFKSKFGEEPSFKLNPEAPWFGKIGVTNPGFNEWRTGAIQTKADVLDKWGTTNEDISDKIVDKKTMDTPTGTLFVMNVGESEK